jgi:hypothetical protein
MASCTALLLLALQALIVTISRAELTVIDTTANESGATERTYVTSKYVYYGSELGAFNAPAVWIHGADICTNSLPDISGKFVVTVRAQTTCLMGDIYERINAGGALVLLELVYWNPPGFLACRHHTWDPHFFSASPNIAWMAVSDPDGSLWQLGSESTVTLRLQVEPPHSDLFEAKYR